MSTVEVEVLQVERSEVVFYLDSVSAVSFVQHFARIVLEKQLFSENMVH